MDKGNQLLISTTPRIDLLEYGSLWQLALLMEPSGSNRFYRKRK